MKRTLILSLLTGAPLIVLGLQAQAQDRITYADHVAQIITDNCVVCHRGGGIGPMQFTTYEQIRPWVPLIQMKVADREMPPYAQGQHIGVQYLQEDWRLSQDEIDSIVAWVDQVAPMGQWGDRDHPVAGIRDTDDWNFIDQFGEPDQVYGSAPMDMPANGNDLWHSPSNDIRSLYQSTSRRTYDG